MDDVIHVVNLLVCMARDGEYASKKHMALYRKFERMLGKGRNDRMTDDMFACLDEEPDTTLAPDDGDLITNWLTFQGYLMAPPPDASPDEMAAAEMQYSTCHQEMQARGLLEAMDLMRPVTHEDYERLRDALMAAGYYESKGDADFYLNARLEQMGYVQGEVMTWEQYNNLQRMVSELCYNARQIDASKKPKRQRKSRSSGGAKNVDKTTEQPTSQSDANVNSPESESANPGTEEAEQYNKFAFLDQIFEWVDYERSCEGGVCPEDNLPTSVHYQALREYMGDRLDDSEANCILDAMGKRPDTDFSWAMLSMLFNYSRPTPIVPKTYQVNEDGEVMDMPAALRMIGENELPHYTDPHAEEVVNKVLKWLNVTWQGEITILEKQHERRVKPLQNKIAWFGDFFGAFIDATTKNLIVKRNTKKDGKISPKYIDYDYGRVSYAVAGGAEVIHGEFETFVEKMGRYKHIGPQSDVEKKEWEQYQKDFPTLVANLKVEYKLQSAVAEKAVEAGAKVPGTKLLPIDALGSKRKVEGIK